MVALNDFPFAGLSISSRIWAAPIVFPFLTVISFSSKPGQVRFEAVKAFGPTLLMRIAILD